MIYNTVMKASEWAKREGVTLPTVWKWCREGKMPVPFSRTETGTYLIHDPKYETAPTAPSAGRTVCYARVSSSDQKDDLIRQADRLKAFAVAAGFSSIETVTETGSGMNENRRKLNRILADPSVSTIIVEHRDRLARMNAGLVISALKAQSRKVIVVYDFEMDDDLERDMAEVLTSFCARFYGKRAAKNRAVRAMEAMKDV